MENQAPANDGAALERTRQVFQYLKAFAERNVPIRRTIAEQLWSQRLLDLPNHPTIAVGEVRLTVTNRQGNANEEPDETPLIRIRRPKLTQPPRPPSVLSDFLLRGWERVDGSIEIQPTRNVTRGRETITERFEDDPARVQALVKWRDEWAAWQVAELPAVRAMRVFERFYALHGRIELESESVELLLADGRLRWQRIDGRVDHPVLLQRVELQFDANVPEFRIVDTDRAPELYGALLQGEGGISPEQLQKLRGELETNGFHPLARDETSGYLRRLAQTLGPRGSFSETPSNEVAGADPLVMRDPVILLRERSSGFPAAFDRVLQDMELRKAIPTSLTRLVGVEPPMPADAPAPQASPWSEPPDVLLSKPANLEQIQIARALERHRAVLVQGPPGTGKSHTIANLIGHLVAHGKRVLVTSHTTKALRVLRQQIVDTLKPLCVAVLENDLDGRTQMEQAVRGILSRLTHANEDGLSREVAELAETRASLNGEIERLTADLRSAREAEYAPILVGGDSIAPADAARWVNANQVGNDWVPGKVEASAPLPLAADELASLYATNGEFSFVEEEEIAKGIPLEGACLSIEKFAELIAALDASEPSELGVYWSRPVSESQIPQLESLFAAVADAAATALTRLEPWQRAIVAAGHAGGAEQQLWADLARMIDEAADRWAKARSMLLEHAPEVHDASRREDMRKTVTEIVGHLANGGTLGTVTLMFRGEWKALIQQSRVNGKSPATVAEFRAIAAYLAVEDGRRKLAVRWSRQAVPVGFPAFDRLGGTPEPTLQDYASQFASLLQFWNSRWSVIESAIKTAGFKWQEFRSREVARATPATPFERDASILSGPLQFTVSARLGVARRLCAERLLAEFEQSLSPFRGPVCSRLADAVRSRDTVAFGDATSQLSELRTKEELYRRRTAILERLGVVAPEWARAIRRREGAHASDTVPGDAHLAWRWRQLRQEIDRRASLDEVALTRRLHQRRDELRTITTDLIDRRAWLGLFRRTDLRARQALQGWADTQKKIGKGTGKRVPEYQAKARVLLGEARDAVPVWIMPLNRVAESFDPTKPRFDVVIVDEASQSDVTGLLAWYLGDRVAVVGDHEQVSPLAVGQQVDAIKALIGEHLSGVPNNHLYDGTTSIYHLARQCFGGTIALREHFRCVPDIIEFSNQLSYNGEIRPLRNPSSAALPHVLECVVDGLAGTGRMSKTNPREAHTVVALLKSMTELPEYSGRSMGAISLVGDEQAGLIQELALETVGALELAQRRFVAGNAAQFQGDERHVVFLSMVDAPTGAPLTLRQTDLFKQRYNVAASRAKDQLWLVHSLDPSRDLKQGDLRRSLIEHARDPGARRRAMESAARRAESPFEVAVIERLVSAGFRVQSQVWVGRYRIDMVVSGDVNQVAIECDGDRFHGVDQIPDDMIRQAILERAGWRFIRIRGTRFYRDPDSTIAWVTQELERHRVKPAGLPADGEQPNAANGSNLRERVLRRAWEIMRERGWLPVAAPIQEVQTDLAV
jgi:very-short-patch-repair endonuclease